MYFNDNLTIELSSSKQRVLFVINELSLVLTRKKIRKKFLIHFSIYICTTKLIK